MDIVFWCLFLGILLGAAGTIACWIELKKLHLTVKAANVIGIVSANSVPASQVTPTVQS